MKIHDNLNYPNYNTHVFNLQGYNYDSPNGGDLQQPGSPALPVMNGGLDPNEQSYPGQDGSLGVDLSNPDAGAAGGYPRGGPGNDNALNIRAPGGAEGYPRGGPQGGGPAEEGYPRGGPGNNQTQLPGGDNGYPRDVPNNRGSGY